MSDYVEKTDLYSTIRKKVNNPAIRSWLGAIIAEQPAADVVPVVRCKDCLFSEERYGHLTCINGMSYRNTWNKPCDFCSYGERRDEAEE